MTDTGIDLSILGIEDVPNAFPTETPKVEQSAPRTENERLNKVRDFVKGDRQREERKHSAPKGPPKRKGQFVQPLTQMYGAIGTGLMMFDPVCAQAIIESAEECAKSLDELAYQNDSVRKVLIALTQTSAMGAVLIAHAPILMVVAMHHLPNLANSPMAAMVANVPGMPEPKSNDDRETATP